MLPTAASCILVMALVCVAPACAEETDAENAHAGEVASADASELTVESIRAICEEIRRWVRGVRLDASGNEVVEDARGRVRRYDWDDPTKLARTFTRRELCRMLVKRYNQEDAGGGHGGCGVTVEDCLGALENPTTYDGDDFLYWMGLHEDTNRNQKHPDDAYWFEPVRWEETQCWRQDVVWYGANPRRGWHCADAHGLWGWDPKLTGHPEHGPGVHPLDEDGQLGWKGAHAGYPFECPDGCRKYIIWILPKEAYLESMDAEGRRVAAGLWHSYTWNVNAEAAARNRRGSDD